MGHGTDAAKALGKMKDAQAARLLKQMLKDPDGSVRVSAIQALSKSKDASVRKLLIQALKDPDPNVRKTAIPLLARTHNARTVKELVTLFGDPDAAVRGQAVHSLWTIGAPAVQALITALEHEDKNVRTSAIHALGRIGDVRAVKALNAVLDDADPDVRKEVPMAVGNIAATAKLQGDSTATIQVANVLVRALEKGDSATRQETIMTLQLLSGQDFGDDVRGWRQWLIDAQVAEMLSEFPKDEGKSVFRW
jgi:HEAT repeat protein